MNRSPPLSLCVAPLLASSRSSVTWRLPWQMVPAEEAPQPTGRPPTTVDAPLPCRPARQTTTARPTSLSTTYPRTWPRRSSAACSAASERSSPASWFATRSQVRNGSVFMTEFFRVSQLLHSLDFTEVTGFPLQSCKKTFYRTFPGQSTLMHPSNFWRFVHLPRILPWLFLPSPQKSYLKDVRPMAAIY